MEVFFIAAGFRIDIEIGLLYREKYKQFLIKWEIAKIARFVQILRVTYFQAAFPKPHEKGECRG